MKDDNTLAKSVYFDYDLDGVPSDKVLALYEVMLTSRLIEEKMLSLLRQGKISKWFSGIGQEAISAAASIGMHSDEFILPMHRNLGVFVGRNVPLDRLFAQWLGKPKGYTKGRDRSFHFGTTEHNIVGMISHLGPQLAVADGIALKYALAKENKAVLVFTGEGGTSEGDFHEALNVAAVWQLPVVFVIENNGYGLSTPASKQYRCEKLSDRGLGYGIPSFSIEGNNVIEVFKHITYHGQRCRDGKGPVLLECNTFRMRGHEEASGVKYVPQHHFDEWSVKDPLANYELFLAECGILTETSIQEKRESIKASIQENWNKAIGYENVQVSTAQELQDVYAMHNPVSVDPLHETKEMRFVDAISDGLKEAMMDDDTLVVMGQDVGDYGGVFKITEGFVDLFGTDRVRDTPLCESAILSASLGYSIAGCKSVVEMQFADFVSSGFTAIVNNLAKSHYRWGQAASVVVRMPTGAGVGAGPYHSQSNEGWFTHTAGLKVVFPSSPRDAKGMLLAAINDPNPVMFFEHKALYRSLKDEVPVGYYTTSIDHGAVVQEGSDVTIITYGMGVHWAKEIAEAIDCDAHIFDLRSLAPLDYDGIRKAVEATGKVLVLQEDVEIGGIGSDVCRWIGEHMFEELDAPVRFISSLQSPVPFHPDLESNYLAKSRLQESLQDLMDY